MIKVSSPTRVDLAGGTLDMWPLFNFVKSAKTINMAISIFTQAEITDFNGVQIESPDLKKTFSFSSVEDFLKSSDPMLSYYQVVVQEMKINRGFRLKTTSQSPVGGGLGGSSSLLISILKAFYLWNQQQAPRPVEFVQFAHNIESQILKTPTGTQDYFPAVCGGINVMEYSSSGLRHEVLNQDVTAFEKNFLLIYTGRSHHSGLNNFDVLSRAVQRDESTHLALHQIKQISDLMVQAIKRADFEALPQLFRDELTARLKLAPSFSSPEIEVLHKLSLQAGADALKICGAGGGGCVMVWLKPSVRERVASECQKAGFEVLQAHPVPVISS